MNPILFTLFIAYFILTIIEINQEERRENGKRKNKKAIIETKF